ncbi:MAG: HtaA domain-containing protein [Acidimicrobiia bacterium]
METVVSNTRRGVRAALVALVVGMLAFGVLIGQSIGAHGDDVVGPAGGEVVADAAQPASNGSLSWRLSEYVFTNPASFGLRSATAPATYDSATSWTFTAGTGTYDPSTGATSLDFTGEMIFENTAAGNYGFKFANPKLTVAAGGVGSVTADVSIRSFGGAPWGSPVTGVTVATFTVSGTTVTTGHVAFTVTPDFIPRTDLSAPGANPNDFRQFPQSLIDTAGASFAGHFRQTAVGQTNKAPAAINVAFDFVPPKVWTPNVGVSKTTNLAYAGETVTVTGTDFDPATNVGTAPPLSGQPTGVYVVFGRFTEPWKPSAAAPAGNREQLASKWVLPAASRAILDPTSTNAAFGTLAADGSFSVELPVAPGGTTAGGYGIAVYAAGGAMNAAHEFLTPITFAAAPPVVEPEPEPEVPTNPVLGGGLDWGVKQSFRSYILTGPANGAITTAGGATTNPDGSFHFPLDATGDEYDGSDVDAAFLGSVHFTGHSGALDMTISDLHVVTNGNAGQIVGDITNTALSSTAVELYDDVVIVDLDLSGITPVVVGTSLVWQNVSSKLASGGAPAFDGFYTTGTPFDPATFAITFQDVPDGNSPTGPKLASLNKTTVAHGESLTVTADGFTPGEQVEVWVHSDPIFIGAARADGNGNVVYTFTVTTAVPVGTHHVEVRGISSSHAQLSGEFSVTGARTLAFTGSNGSSANLALLGGVMVILGAGALLAAHRQRRRQPLEVS